MSQFSTEIIKNILPYTPGEQPKAGKYIKLNTNESPFPPSNEVLQAVKNEASKLNLYSDPTAKELVDSLAELYNVESKNVFVGNGSDEVLGFIFKAFFEKKEVAFADVTYGFYEVYSELFASQKKVVKVREDLTINLDDYKNLDCGVVIANPNAQTGLYIEPSDIEGFVKANRNRLVVVDEAYIDFGGKSVIPLIKKYANLAVVSTMSKSKCLAGARLGYLIANEEIIKDVDKVKYSFNSYNVNSLSQKAGTAAIASIDYYTKNCAIIASERDFFIKELKSLGYKVYNSKANFVLLESPELLGIELYNKLRDKGILVRYLGMERIKNTVRITIGSPEQMKILIEKIKMIGERK